MCEAHEVREYRDRSRLESAADLAGSLACKLYRAGWRIEAAENEARTMRHQRNMALFTVGMVFLLVFVSAVWK